MKVSIVAALYWVTCVAAYNVKTYLEYGVGGRTYYGCSAAVASQATFCKLALSGGRGGGHHKRKSNLNLSCFCLNVNALATVAGCYAFVGRNNSGDYNYFLKTCAKLGYALDMDNMTYAYQYYVDNAETKKQIHNFSTSSVISVPLKLNTTAVELYINAYDEFYGNYDDSMYWGYGLVGYWVLLALVSAVANWGVIVFPGLRRTFDGRMSRFWRKYVLLPALGKRKRASLQRFGGLFDFLVPSRVESLAVFGFFWLLFTLCAGNIFYVENDPIMKSKTKALHRYVADRTGIMCILIMPLLLLFGGRNNILLWVTRWKFSTMIVFHRWIGRLVVLLALIHAICYTVLYVQAGSYTRRMQAEFLVWGTTATVAGGIICFQGLLYFRRKYYDVFLVLHILLAVVFVMGAWFHIVRFKYTQVLYPSFAVWVFDRLVRVGRMVAFGAPKSTVELISDETLKVTVKRPSYWKPIPGGHAWVYFMHGLRFWQSHPFTYVEEGDVIHFYCKVKNGITKSLYKKLAKLPGKSTSMRVCVEGPYGFSAPVTKHSDVEFLAGGSGIPGLLSELQELLRRSPDSKQRLKFSWIIREVKSIAWMYSEFVKLKDTRTELTVYITRPDLLEGSDELASLFTSSDSDSNKEKDVEKVRSGDVLENLHAEFPNIRFVEGRPDIKAIVTGAITEAASSVAFVTCGHPEMVDEVRYHCVDWIDKTEKRVDYYQAMELWA